MLCCCFRPAVAPRSPLPRTTLWRCAAGFSSDAPPKHTAGTMDASQGTALLDHLRAPAASAYDSTLVERSEWNEVWGKHMRERARARRGEVPFTMLLPPPNVTGSLHLGHALTVSIQDALARYAHLRSNGSRGSTTVVEEDAGNVDSVLWIPGMDHAGIATQVVVERRLAREGLSRHSVGRAEFVRRTWQWKTEHGGRIEQQLQRMGLMLNDDRKYFTLDQQRSEAVAEAFVRLHDAGLIYRARRLVNWSCALQSAISDIEVENTLLEGSTMISVPSTDAPGQKREVEFGVGHDVLYPLAPDVSVEHLPALTRSVLTTSNGRAGLAVFTTRPETLPADVALAVHPDDPRYSSLVGQHVVHPLNGTRIPVIEDAELVDPEKGTGVVKVTPFHDERDWACGTRHGLSSPSAIGRSGRMTALGGAALEGLDRFDGREHVLQELQRSGCYLGKADHRMVLFTCSRSGDVLEPMLLPQWYVRCADSTADNISGLAGRALDAVQQGEVQLLPQWYLDEYERWMKPGSIRDWCISRQLWWGHRVPAFRVVQLDEAAGDKLQRDESDDAEHWIVARSEEEALEKAQRMLGANVGVVQDEDVLDTWFSSALLPLSSVGWPHRFESHYYPLSLMETGSDILFFWVARMMMLCTYLHPEQKAPFRNIFLHPVIRDREGKKMSKSKGNVIDPLDIIDGCALDDLQLRLEQGNLPAAEVERASAVLEEEFPEGFPKCGSDALRLTLCGNITGAVRDLRMDPTRVVTNRLLCNKIWNAYRFISQRVDEKKRQQWRDPEETLRSLRATEMSLVNRWLLSSLAVVSAEYARGMERYSFAECVGSLTKFFLSQFCDSYIEMAKVLVEGDGAMAEETRKVLVVGGQVVLQLLHPFMPYLSENSLDHPLISTRLVPQDVWQELHDPRLQEDMKNLLEAIHAIRSVRAGCEFLPTERIDSLRIDVDKNSEPLRQLLSSNTTLLKRLCNIDQVIVEELDRERDYSSFVSRGVGDNAVVRVELRLQHPEVLEKELARQRKRLNAAKAKRDRLRSRTEVAEYKTRVPAIVQEKDRKGLAELELSIDQYEATITALDAALLRKRNDARDSLAA